MHVILIAYKIRKDAGSEDGSGYGIAADLLRRDIDVTLISRKDNVEYLRNDPLFSRARLVGIDVPKKLAWFKRGSRGVILYYYLWQIVVSCYAKRLARDEVVDVIHQLNFHTDWAAHFLWKARVPIVWGPIGHHPRIPRAYFLPRAWRGRAQDALRHMIKQVFWRFDPFLRLAARRSTIILYANLDIAPPFRQHKDKLLIRPYAGSFLSTADSLAGQHTSTFRVLWVGRFVEMKGLVPAIQAFRDFGYQQKERGAIELVIVGDGPLQSAIPLVAGAGLRGQVRVVPWVRQPELTKLYASSSVFLYPSVEAQGLVVAEALSAGLPVIAVAGTGPALLAGSSGWTVRGEHLVPELAAALKAAYKEWSAGNIATRRETARARYESYLDWPNIGDFLLRAYQSAISPEGLPT